MPTIDGIDIDFDKDMPDLGALRELMEPWLVLPEHLLGPEVEHGAKQVQDAIARADDPLKLLDAQVAAMQYALASIMVGCVAKRAEARHLREHPEELEEERRLFARQRVADAAANVAKALRR